MNSKYILIIIVTLLLNGCNCVNESINKISPERIILSLTSDPSSSIAVTWRTKIEIKNPIIQIAVAREWTELEENSYKTQASSEKVILDNKDNVFHYSVIASDLSANTIYAYRVGGDSVFSEWNQFTTASVSNDPFEFVYLGDAQHDVKQHVSRLFRTAYSIAPKASFWLSTGDLLDRAEVDYQWEDFFSAASFLPKVTPFVLTSGNHEYQNLYEDGIKVGERLVDLWRSHITQPSSTIEGLDETVFFIDYQNIRLIVLNGNEKLEEQALWLVKVLTSNKQKWTIISLHQPIFSMGKNRDKRKTRDAFLQIIDKFNVDLVLQGHDHVYSRTYKLYEGNIVNNTDKGTVYVVSNCGSDSYRVESPYLNYAAKLGNKVQLFQVISVSNSSLLYRSYNVIGEVYDQFELRK